MRSDQGNAIEVLLDKVGVSWSEFEQRIERSYGRRLEDLEYDEVEAELADLEAFYKRDRDNRRSIARHNRQVRDAADAERAAEGAKRIAGDDAVTALVEYLGRPARLMRTGVDTVTYVPEGVDQPSKLNVTVRRAT